MIYIVQFEHWKLAGVAKSTHFSDWIQLSKAEIEQMNTISSIGKMAHIFLSGALLLLGLFNGFTQPAVAAAPVTGNTFVVNSALDTPNADPATGVCADAQGRCTLRAAIMVADFVSGASTIVLPAGIY
jgi:CSLREA domain-containing protein